MSTLAVARPASTVLGRRLEAARRSADEGHWVLLFGVASVVLALLFAALAFTRVDDARGGIDVIGREAIPSIDAADQAASLLSGMDTHSIENALAGPGGSQTARDAFLATRAQVDQQLRGMLRTSSVGDRQDTSIASLQAGLHEYDVRYGLHTAETRLGFPLGAAQQRAASDVIDTAAIPGALAVDDATTTFLTAEFVRRQNATVIGQLAVVAGGAVVLVVLVAGQRFMARTYGRLLNRMLLAGTVLVALFGFLVVRALGVAGSDLRDMALGVHTSIHALQLARVELEHARRAQSLFLLEQGHGDRYDRDFAVEVSRAFCAHGGTAAAPDLTSACQPLTGPMAARIQSDLGGGVTFSGRAPGALDQRYTGYLADALRNVSHGNQELDATLSVVGALTIFENVDAQMRDLDNNNQHAEAIAFNTGSQPGQGGWVFDQVERGLQSAIDVNRTHYEAALDDASATLDFARTAAPLVALLVVVLVWLGVQPTISRYRLP